MSESAYTYQAAWSEEDGQYVGTCLEFPSLSFLADEPGGAIRGVRQLVTNVVADLPNSLAAARRQMKAKTGATLS